MQNKKGISLLVLVVTIIVMIILAGVVVANLQENNPISKANFSRICETTYTIRTAFAKYAIKLDKKDLDVVTEINKMLIDPPCTKEDYIGYKKLNMDSEDFKTKLDLNYHKIPAVQDIVGVGNFWVNPQTGEVVFELTEEAFKKFAEEILPDGIVRPNSLS